MRVDSSAGRATEETGFPPPPGTRLSVRKAKPTVAEPAVVVLDRYGVVKSSNTAADKLLKRSRDELLGQELAPLLPGLPLRRTTPDYNLAFADFWGQEAKSLRFDGLLPNGKHVPLAVSLTKLSAENAEFILLGLQPKKNGLDPGEELDRLIKGAEQRNDSVMITDAAGIIRFVNAAFEKSTGYLNADAVGRPATIIKSGLHPPAFYKCMWDTLLAGHNFHAVFANRRKNGEIFHEYKDIRPFVDAGGKATHFVSTSHSLSESLRSTLAHLQQHAYHDALTALPNRNLFLDRLRQACLQSARRGDAFALVYVDLDDFKEINDGCGHAAGDAVLATTASRLQASVRDEDTVARLGGDEFAIILLDIRQRENLPALLQKMLDALADGPIIDQRRISIRASLGASLYPRDAEDCAVLMHQADQAMYAAKAAGGNCFRLFEAGAASGLPAADTSATR